MPRKLRSGERVRVLPVPSARPVRAASRHEVHALVVALPRGAGPLRVRVALAEHELADGVRAVNGALRPEEDASHDAPPSEREAPPPDVHFHT